jgi:hypothetical protein
MTMASGDTSAAKVGRRGELENRNGAWRTKD